MLTSNRVKERIGINAVSHLVEVGWHSGWQEYAAHNDDAIDGVILMRRGHAHPADTGGLVFVQVKCGGNGYRRDQKQHPDHIGVNLSAKYINEHRPRWLKTVGPTILIFVDDTIDQMNPPAWWVDLKSNNSYSTTNKGMILVPKRQKFTSHSKGDFHRLCGAGIHDGLLETFTLDRSDVLSPCLNGTKSFREEAWDYYKEWKDDPIQCNNPTLGSILVNRNGWKHITRKGRLPERITQSWSLLGAAKRMICSSTKIFNLGNATVSKYPDGNTNTIDYLGLRANIVFPHRHQSIVQVVLKRSRLVCPNSKHKEREKIWFHSVYELRRGMHII